MGRFERDTLMRQVRQMADVIAALVLRARSEGDYESGLEAIRTAAGGGLGVDYAMLDRLAPGSAAMLLRSADLIRTYAWICEQEADLYERAGDQESAAARRLRATELYAEAEARGASGAGSPA